MTIKAGMKTLREEAVVKGPEYASLTILIALTYLVEILDEIAGPYCGHGFRVISCPYSHMDEPFREEYRT